jgi:hypothetical protein
MCEFCSEDEKEREVAKKTAALMAESLERMAVLYRSLSRGTIKPHTTQYNDLGVTAKLVLRQLFEDWV